MAMNVRRIGPVFVTVFAAFAFFMSGDVMLAEGSTEPAALRPDLPYQARQSEPIVHDVDFSVTVTPPYGCKLLKVWLPLPQSDNVQEISNRRLSTFPDDVTPAIGAEAVYDNTFAYFEFKEPQGAQIIRHRFTARVHNLYWNVEPDKVATVKSWPKAFDPYLQAQSISTSSEFDRLLSQLVPRKQGPARDLFAVIDWADKHLTYDHRIASLSADADHAFTLKGGHCSDYHGLCATMGCALGYPTARHVRPVARAEKFPLALQAGGVFAPLRLGEL